MWGLYGTVHGQHHQQRFRQSGGACCDLLTPHFSRLVPILTFLWNMSMLASSHSPNPLLGVSDHSGILPWLIVTCLGFAYIFIKASRASGYPTWLLIKEIILLKVRGISSCENLVNLMCSKLEVYRWNDCMALAFLSKMSAAGFDLIQSKGQVLARMQKLYNGEFSLQILVYVDHLQTIK